MIHSLAFCCEEKEKAQCFSMIWDWCTYCRSIPAIFYFPSIDSLREGMLHHKINGVIFIQSNLNISEALSNFRTTYPKIPMLYFSNIENLPNDFSYELASFPLPVTKERMEQALSWFGIIKPSNGSSRYEVHTAPGSITAERMIDDNLLV